jgi:hypothetical protein
MGEVPLYRVPMLATMNYHPRDGACPNSRVTHVQECCTLARKRASSQVNAPLPSREGPSTNLKCTGILRQIWQGQSLKSISAPSQCLAGSDDVFGFYD